MDIPVELTLSARVLIAALLGAFVGSERGRHHMDAGIRTYAAVSLGACVFGCISTHVVSADLARISAQVVTGIGFICAGVIFRDRGRLSGLTTGATLWATAAVGLGVAYGFYILSSVSALITYVLLRIGDLPVLKRNRGEWPEENEERG